jgi:NADP-dependent 3-hydroxy acid dehydrogenase YdfG
MACTDVDYKGVVYGTQLAIHFMRKNSTPGGSIIATASIAAVHPHETYPEYDGAKAAVSNTKVVLLALSSPPSISKFLISILLAYIRKRGK